MKSEKKIKTQKTVRFYQLGNPSAKTKYVWFVFHGYGQLAGEFILNFSNMINEETIIIAPEAMNKFYLRGFKGRVGATWMTTEDRLNEIDDYVNMIIKIYAEIFSSLNCEEVKTNVLGFSQGTHTAVRWLNSTKTRIDNLFLWSGTFTHDINYITNFEYWSKVKTLLVLGNQDRFITEEHIKNELEFIKTQKIKHDLIRYNGGHKIESDQLLSIINNI